ncbi:hypothetical protein [Clostridium grantii]|uniref:hypothetical protein n=1 Tax=Clostridium grantii TaxID=40575 RepID=UPI0011602AF8|nr:hypothetical protein [Clostridium grantii]
MRKYITCVVLILMTLANENIIFAESYSICDGTNIKVDFSGRNISDKKIDVDYVLKARMYIEYPDESNDSETIELDIEER